MMLLTLRGSVFLYYGDELGMLDTDVPKERLVDPVGDAALPRATGATRRARRCRGAASRAPGSPTPGVEPWLPFGDVAACNVEDQRRDPESLLSLCRDLISLRTAVPELRTGGYARSTRPTAGCGPGAGASGSWWR